MPANFDKGFTVREPAWHHGTVVLDDYPGREEGMKLAGHDFKVIEMPLAVVTAADEDWANIDYREASGWKALMKDDADGAILSVVKDSYEVIQNDVGWDIVDAMVGEGARYDAGVTLKGGAVCVVTAWLDEPVTIPGDNSTILPYSSTRWQHDGGGALSTRAVTVRTVCSNTDELAQAEARRLGTEFTFSHTKNVMDRIEDAKMAIRGMRLHQEAFVQLSLELAKQKVTKPQIEYFLTEFIPSPPEAMISDRVAKNIETARNAVRGILASETVPDAHRRTAYGLRLAAVEYLDHFRPYRTQDSYVGRTLLRTEPQKAKLAKLLRETVKA